MNKILVCLFLISSVGAGAELYLLDHYETWWQRAPLIALAVGLVSGLAILAVPRRSTLRVHRAVMVVFVAAGFVGSYLHYQVNEEFQLELYPSMKGLELFNKSLKGATPALAPFAMAQFGLLGLISTYRYPLRAPRRDQTEE